MKIRTSFVSNSSSSSFCLVGVVVGDGNFPAVARKFKTGLLKAGYEKSEIADMDAGEILNAAFNNDSCFPNTFDDEVEIRNGIDEYAGDVVAGISISLMKDDETLGKFKKKACAMLKKFGYKGDKDEIGVLIDGGYDG